VIFCLLNKIYIEKETSILMKKRIFLGFAFVFILISILASASAHQPRIVDKLNLSDAFMTVENPEVSQAFYGELKGLPEYYGIDNERFFHLYVQILSPDLKDSRTDFIVRIILPNNTVMVLNDSNWAKFHEDFGNDNYNQGPSFEKNVSGGVYEIIVSNDNSNNTGKYVIVFGKEEKFPLKEMINAFAVMPRLKIYFEKSPFTAYFNRIGIYSLVALFILIVIIVVLVVIFKRRTKEVMPL
jgi:hypothetical protein